MMDICLKCSEMRKNVSRQAERIYALSKKHSLVSGNRKINPQKKSSNQFVSDQCFEMSNCFVCNEALSLVKENRLVKNKGVQTLLKSANIRGDVENELYYTIIQIHVKNRLTFFMT